MSRGVSAGLMMALVIAAGCTTDRRVGAVIDPVTPDDGGSADLPPVGGDPRDTAPPTSDGPSSDLPGGELRPDGLTPTPYFPVISAGKPLPSEAACAAMVRRGTPESRPDNTSYNNSVPPPEQVALLSQFGTNRGFDNAAVPFGKRVSGDFTGTTDEILQWAACKWGFDEDVVRAESYQVNGWHQATMSGWTSDTTNCPMGGPTRMGPTGTECAQVFGIFGVTFQFHKSSWPMVRDSTAFNVDYSLGLQRVCFEGLTAYMKGWVGTNGKVYGPGDHIGCAAAFFTGDWYSNTAQQTVSRIKDTLANKPWTKTTM